MKRDLRFEVFLPHPPEEVWEMLTDSTALAEWLMPNDFAPVVGHEFQFRDKPQPGWDGIVRCKVLEVSPPRRLAYTWMSSAIDTVVEWNLQAETGGTRLVVEHQGFRGIRGLLISSMLSKGWKSQILGRKLPAAMARRSSGQNTKNR